MQLQQQEFMDVQGEARSDQDMFASLRVSRASVRFACMRACARRSVMRGVAITHASCTAERDVA